MTNIALITNDPSLAQHWIHQAQDADYTITSHPSIAAFLSKDAALPQQTPQLVFVHFNSKTIETADFKILLSKAHSVLVLANQPSCVEALDLFQQGIKGYLNAYANHQRVEQILQTVQAGNVWLGQNLLNELILATANSTEQTNSALEALQCANLTEREVETANLILQGKSNLQIAQSLNISESTVKKHVKNLLEKHQVKDRLALVIKLRKAS
ncbi:MAG: response regulator transcription factor [Thiotrichales bacterium]|nr:response regulator transcription factor [Thiotrichales bacterium]